MRAPARLLPGIALAAGGAVAFSGKAIIVKLAYRYGVDAVTLLMMRMLIALPLFLLMGWWASRGKPPLTRGDWLGVIGLGFSGFYLSSYLDFLGLQYISASLERLILYLSPTIVMLLGWMLHRKAWTRHHLLGMGLSYCGVLAVIGNELSVEGTNVALGALLVFASAVSIAVYFVLGEQVVRKLGSLRLVGLATSVACICCIAQFLVMRPVELAFVQPAAVWWLSLLNGTLCTVVPVLAMMMAIERIGPALAAQISMVGPLSTIALSVWLLGELFTGWVMVGTALVLAGIFVFSRAQEAPQRRSQNPDPSS